MRRSRTSSETEPALKVGDDFAEEFPDADPLSAECYMNLVRVGEQLLNEIGRRLKNDFDLSPSAATVLAIIEGAGGEISPNVIAERAIISSASATSVLDTLERRGLVERLRHPSDRRRIIIRLMPESYQILDCFLPGAHGLEWQVMSVLTPGEQRKLLELVARVQASIARVAEGPPQALAGRRNIPDRLGRNRIKQSAGGGGVKPSRRSGEIDLSPKST